MANTTKSAPTTQDFDREFRAQVAQMTAGLAPTAFTTAWADWAMHLALSPAKRWLFLVGQYLCSPSRHLLYLSMNV